MTNIDVSQQLFNPVRDAGLKFADVDYDNLMEQKTPVLVGAKFLAREKAKVFDFNLHAAHEPIILSNKLVLESFETRSFGLAAPQIGIDYKVIAIAGLDFAMFNPTITFVSGDPVTMDEICPSFPLSRLQIKRAPHVEIRYLDPHGKFTKRLFTGMTARIVQQLIEILDGKSVLDHFSEFKQKKILKKHK